MHKYDIMHFYKKSNLRVDESPTVCVCYAAVVIYAYSQRQTHL